MAAAQGKAASFYRRELPSSCISLLSAEGKAVVREALDDGTAETFLLLMSNYRTQNEPPFCGLSTLVNILNALQIDPMRTWAGPWRWFHEDMLDCCAELDEVRRNGITLTEFACLGRCNGASVTTWVARQQANEVAAEAAFEGSPFEPDLKKTTTAVQAGDLDTFRNELVASCMSGTEGQGSVRVVAANYSRKVLGQTGTGHFSPLGAFHREKDLVLILDVARFKYDPHWVPVALLHEAMCDPDSSTGQPRGFAVVSQVRAQRVFVDLLARGKAAWQRLTQRYNNTLPAALASAKERGTARGCLDAIAGVVADDLGTVYRPAKCGGDVTQEVQKQVEKLPLFALLAAALPEQEKGSVEVATVVLLALGSVLGRMARPHLDNAEEQARFDDLLHVPDVEPISSEVRDLRAALFALVCFCEECGPGGCGYVPVGCCSAPPGTDCGCGPAKSPP
mmetsp:Transcript_8450/g.35305  ORF Transcript_8450/g.35305 Transcript_8450/m.35305 type:complete len:451 (-) Transcript_8450:32-1384(-)